MELIGKIKNNLDKLYDFHVVPGWRWSESLWVRFKEKFNQIPMCHDQLGNVYLNCESLDDLFQNISEGNLLVLQAHLDHPGGVVVAETMRGDDSHLYSAVWFGGYRGTLEGKIVSVCKLENNETEDCLLEADINHFGERIIYFWSKKKYNPKDVIHYPGRKSEFDFNEGIADGWALDDQLVCAILLEFFNKIRPKKVIGLLSLDEERGVHGISYFKYLIGMKCDSNKPLLINIDCPSENEDHGISLGDGPIIRTADSHSQFSEVIVSRLKQVFPKFKCMSITTGGTEAGLLSRYGWEVGSLALPIRYAHNGSVDQVWCNEEASIKDIEKLYYAIEDVSKTCWGLHSLSGLSYEQKPSVNITDEATEIVDAIGKTCGYGDFLLNIAGLWNKKHKEYGDKVVHISSEEYRGYRQKIVNGEIKTINREALYSTVLDLFPKISNIIGVTRREPLNVYMLLSGSFNAKHVQDGIALSVEKLDFRDIQRVLAHEMTHWFVKELTSASYPRAPIRGLINEGLACYVSKEVVKISSARALNIDEKTYSLYRGIDSNLRKNFKKIIQESSVVLKGNKHKVLEYVDQFDPFLISADNPYNKYGYYLGIEFVDYCMNNNCKLNDIICNPSITLPLLNNFLAE